MNYQVVLQSEAVADIQTAFEWYEGQLAGLGYELIEEIEEALERLARHHGIIRLPIRSIENCE